MPKNRGGYLLAAAVLAGFLLYYDKSFFLWCVAVLGILAVILHMHLWREAGRFRVHARIPAGIHAGRRVVLALEVSGREWLSGTGSLAAVIEAEYTMFGTRQRETLYLDMSGNGSVYEIPINTNWCGEICIRCVSLQALDPLKLFRIPMEPFKDVRSMIYPRPTQLCIEREKDRSGMTEQEGYLQNRKGHDRNEIYEVREYMPGDDLRSIHWKLSEKTGTLMLRESSSPSHFDLLLLPELAGNSGKENTGTDILNKAVSTVIAAGEELLAQGTLFCLAVPGENELEPVHIQSTDELLRAVGKWMSVPIPEQEGTMLRYFLSQQLQRHFTKLLIVCGGQNPPALSELEGRISYTAVCVAAGLSDMQVQRNAYGVLVQLPAQYQPEKVYRILC